jgi:hypothetical protein
MSIYFCYLFRRVVADLNIFLLYLQRKKNDDIIPGDGRDDGPLPPPVLGQAEASRLHFYA